MTLKVNWSLRTQLPILDGQLARPSGHEGCPRPSHGDASPGGLPSYVVLWSSRAFLQLVKLSFSEPGCCAAVAVSHCVPAVRELVHEVPTKVVFELQLLMSTVII
jgi:hypothetical protein